ncbi:hypothetical protein HHK36_022008 [Tetracentron sinense]|uniref:Uncharacterized protein n=1 Tax=Tetracentron sinense TaxID=13715 RepID=A0A835D9A2_TETSI|nr:hypothetical protein HHK36_022008 [Tetracentron sinense]
MLADYLGNLARDGHLFRLDVPSWLHIDKEQKQQTLELVRVKSDIEPFAEKFILASLGHKYRDWKAKQRRENVIPGATPEQLLAAAAEKLKKSYNPSRKLHVQVTHSMPPQKIEVFKSMENWAEKNILVHLKPVEKSWQPQDFLPDPA